MLLSGYTYKRVGCQQAPYTYSLQTTQTKATIGIVPYERKFPRQDRESNPVPNV
jgi:hypothetical protein